MSVIIYSYVAFMLIISDESENEKDQLLQVRDNFVHIRKTENMQ